MDTRSVTEFAGGLDRRYASFRSGAFARRRFSPEELRQALGGVLGSGAGVLSMRTAGSSFEGRPIPVVSAGSGPTTVLLWSQMHGDESTGTMAIVDILSYLSGTRAEETTRELLSRLTLLFVPMLNPDGAARFQRRTAQGIDMNRDALALATPEARVLKQLRDDLRPQFAFNLHDQELSTVGASKELTAVALLAPAFDAARSDNDIRLRAKHMAACFAAALGPWAAGRIARYDDAYEPRAFGDTMQQSGVSTLLVESGHVPDDPEKDGLRRLNAVGILSCCHAIAGGALALFGRPVYEELPLNGKQAYDLIIRNVHIGHASGAGTPADIAVSYQVDTNTDSNPMLADLGDLRTFTGLREIDGRGKRVPQELLEIGRTFDWEGIFAGPMRGGPS